jgi:transposase
MQQSLTLRPLAAEEATALRRLAHSRAASARAVRTRPHLLAGAPRPGRSRRRRRRRGLRSDGADLDQTVQRRRPGRAGRRAPGRRPPTYTAAEIGAVVAASLTDPQQLGLPFASWTLDRLAAYLAEERGIPIKRSRIGEVLRAEGLRWRTQEGWFGERPDPAFAEKRGPSSPSTRRRPTMR